MKRKYPRKFCVIGDPDPEIRDGKSGRIYSIAAEWSYIDGKINYIMDWTPGWLDEIINSCCPNNDEDVESVFWISDSEIDALKSKADFVAEEGVTMTDSEWDTHGEEEQEQEEFDKLEEIQRNQAYQQHFFSKITPGTMIFMCHAITCIGKVFVVGKYVRLEYNKDNNPVIILKDPIVVEPDGKVLANDMMNPKITRKTGEEGFTEASFGRDPQHNIVPINDPSITEDVILQRFAKRITYKQNIIRL